MHCLPATPLTLHGKTARWARSRFAVTGTCGPSIAARGAVRPEHGVSECRQTRTHRRVVIKEAPMHEDVLRSFNRVLGPGLAALDAILTAPIA